MTYLETSAKKEAVAFQSRAECKPLLEAATRDLFRKNAFRVLGLTVDATVREVSKHGAKLKQMEELGLGMTPQAAAFPTHPSPAHDDIRAALQRLQDPEKRMVDEFFWFWPEQFGESKTDPACQALQAGDTKTAVEIWTLRESAPAGGALAKHNLAVLWHMTAIECEAGETGRSRVDGYWKDALTRWEQLVNDEILWEMVRQRVRQINDPRLTSGFAHRLRTVLPEAIGKINGELALHYAEANETEAASAQARFMRETNRGLLSVEHLAQLVLGSITHRLKEQIAVAKRAAAAKPADGANAALILAGQASQTVRFYDLICGSPSRFRNDTFDEVAEGCNRMIAAYVIATGNEQHCVEALQTVLPFTTLDSLRKHINQNIVNLGTRLASRKSRAQPAASRPATPSQPDKEASDQKIARVLTKHFEQKTLAEVIAGLKSIQAGTDSPAEKLAKVNWLWLAKLEAALADLSTETDTHWTLSDAAGNLLRAISLQAGEQRRDMATAMAANELAFRFAKSPKLWSSLKLDRQNFQRPRGLVNNLKQYWLQLNDVRVVFIVGAIVAVWFFISLIRGDRERNAVPTITNPPANPFLLAQTPRAQLTPVAAEESSTIAAPAPAAPSSEPVVTYRIPATYTNELAADRQAIADQRQKLAELNHEETALLFRTNAVGPDYNPAANLKHRQIQQATRKLNEMIASYNSKLKLYGNPK